MLNIISLALLLIAILVCTPSITKIKSASFVIIVASVFFGLFAFLSGLALYMVAIAVAALVLLFFLHQSVKEYLSKFLFQSGVASCLGGVLVILIDLFLSPSSGEIEVEDRTNWNPPPVVERTPQELLQLKWSTNDLNADWPVACLMLDLSDIAYDPPATAREKIKKLGWDSESVNTGSMQGYVVDAGDDSIITLRGTERHEYDILQDLRFLKVKTEQGAMHGGFAKGYNPMHDQVVTLLERYETKRVWITGHSLGGGLAVVCAYRLLVDGKYPIAGMMTFGQPTVVRKDLAKFLGPKLDGKYVFFVNDMDPITRLIRPYEHFGHMVRWTGNNIERSKKLLMSSNSNDGHSDASAYQEAGYIEGMTDTEFQELLQQSEDAQKPKYDEKGNLLVQGSVPNASDHFLKQYRYMLEKLRTHSTGKAHF